MTSDGSPPAPPEWFEPRLPSPAECSLGHLLRERARIEPEGAFAAFDNGVWWTNSGAADAAASLARAFHALGVRPGDMVAIWQPNGPNMLRALFACSLLGATACLLNVAFRGNLLAHALALSDARLLYAHGDLTDRLGAIDCGPVELVLVSESTASALSRPEVRHEAAVEATDAEIDVRLVEPWDLAAIIFTSGTTGASKGVRVTAAQLWTLGRAYYGYMRADDRMLLMLPLFHIAALGALHGAMSSGGSLSVMESFRPADFWRVVRETGATTNVGSGSALISLLLKSPPGPADRDHALRLMLTTSNDETARAFSERFGCAVFSGYSMSETSVIAMSEPNPTKPRSVGRIRKGVEGRLVDAHDVEVPRGQPGEMILRADLPWVLNDGYHKNPEATAQAWRNGWFHTGDVFVQDEDGDLVYVDRIKDVIRRRGENISSLELEAEIRACPAVRDVAAIAADTPDGEEVLAVVEPMLGEPFDPVALIEFLIPRIPHFMAPRFVRVVERLPRTETNKIQKAQLRSEGLTPDTWDREAAGLRIRRQKLAI
jgi:crotonobetaine/carnitine-CoA ligase